MDGVPHFYDTQINTPYNWSNVLDANTFDFQSGSPQCLAPGATPPMLLSAEAMMSDVEPGDLQENEFEVVWKFGGEEELKEKPKETELRKKLKVKELNERDDEILRRLVEEQNSWPLIEVLFKEKTGQRVTLGALRMRYKRQLKYPFTEIQIEYLKGQPASSDWEAIAAGIPVGENATKPTAHDCEQQWRKLKGRIKNGHRKRR